MKQRYVASIEIVASYEVLNTRTSEKKGAAPTIDATVGIVTRFGSSRPWAGTLMVNRTAGISRSFLMVNLRHMCLRGRTTFGCPRLIHFQRIFSCACEDEDALSRGNRGGPFRVTDAAAVYRHLWRRRLSEHLG